MFLIEEYRNEVAKPLRLVANCRIFVANRSRKVAHVTRQVPIGIISFASRNVSVALAKTLSLLQLSFYET